MSLLKFQEWNQINESKTIDKIINWFSGSFGGKIEKIDDLIKKYKDLELKFVDEWEEIKIDDDELKLSRSQIKYDPAEITKIDRMMQRNRELVEASKKSHSKKVDEIFSKLKEVIGSNKRLKDYWEVAKVRTDADVAEEMYKKAKKLTDKTEAESLYSRYKQAAIDARTKDEYFRETYGDLAIQKPMLSTIDSRSSSIGLSQEEVGSSEASFEMLSKLPVLEFAEATRGFSRDQSRKLLNFLIKERNDLYLAMDIERDALNSEISGMERNSSTLDYASKRTKEIREKYLTKIRELRTKITVCKKYV
jgi:hypothetical protein